MTHENTFEHVAGLIDKLGRDLLASKGFADDGWSAMALVVRIEGAVVQHGFKYYLDGSNIPASETSFETTFLFVELANLMENVDGRRWKTCLVQMMKPEMKIRMQYEYQDVNRWRVTPANLDSMRESMRPE